MYRFILLYFVCFSCFSASLPKQLCFETRPTHSYLNNPDFYVGVYDWPTTIEEVYASPFSDFAVIRYQLVFTNKIKDSNGYLNFSFIGHSRAKVGDVTALIGSGYYINNKWKFNIYRSLAQTTQGKLGPMGAYPVYDMNSVWDFAGSLKEGTAFIFNDNVNSHIITTNHTDNTVNDFGEGIVYEIPCKQYNF